MNCIDLNELIKYVRNRRKESIGLLCAVDRHCFIKEHCTIRLSLPRRMGNTYLCKSVKGATVLYPKKPDASMFFGARSMANYNEDHDDTLIIDHASSLTTEKLDKFIVSKLKFHDLNKFVLVLVG